MESCEAVSASSSSDSRDTFRGSESVGDGGGRILEFIIAGRRGNFLLQCN